MSITAKHPAKEKIRDLEDSNKNDLNGNIWRKE